MYKKIFFKYFEKWQLNSNTYTLKALSFFLLLNVQINVQCFYRPFDLNVSGLFSVVERPFWTCGICSELCSLFILFSELIVTA